LDVAVQSGGNELLKEEVMAIHAVNARNQFKGRVKEIVTGLVVSEVDVETPAGIVTAVITTRSVQELGLSPGSEVLALVKATDVSIAKL
jgi:molybdopterin-binding protein